MKFLNTLQWRIVLSYTALIVASMGALSIYMVNFVQDSYISNLEETLEEQASLIGESTNIYLHESHNIDKIQEVSDRIGILIGARVTIVDLTGVVIADTWEDPSHMDNHISRDEIQAALKFGSGKSTRLSGTVGEEMFYTAVPIILEDDTVGISRIAVPTAYLEQTTRQIIVTIALSALIVTFLSLALGYMLARRTSRSVHLMTEAAIRLSNGDLDQHVESISSDETEDLAKAFNRMSSALKAIVGDLSIERNKMSAVLDTMADGVVVIKRLFYLRQGEGIIELINPAAEQLLALSPGSATGGRFVETVHNHQLQSLVADALTTESTRNREIELVYPRRYLSAIATPLTGEGDPGVLVTLHDLPRIRQVDATRRQFVSNASHEIRSPLASIKAMTETLENGAIEEPTAAKEFIGRIHKDVDRMTNIVNDLLELSLLESNQADLTASPMDITNLLEEINQEFLPQCIAKDISLTIMRSDSIPYVLAEKDRIHQVMINLLDNSLKFTPKGGAIHITVDVENNNVITRVSDTGMGISEQDQLHIFERFYRVDSSRTYQGTGLGLSIARHIIEFYGGVISVTSSQGKGSVFSFTLPAHF